MGNERFALVASGAGDVGLKAFAQEYHGKGLHEKLTGRLAVEAGDVNAG